MSETIKDRLEMLGVTLPTPALPVSNYVPFVRTGNTLYISGQLPVDGAGKMMKGIVGENLTIEDGQAAARLCAINILAQVNGALGGDLSRIVRCVKLGGFVASLQDFTDHPKVINGASDFIVAALGDAGRHTRFAVGVAGLPFGVPVEIDGIFEVQ